MLGGGGGGGGGIMKEEGAWNLSRDMIRSRRGGWREREREELRGVGEVRN